MERPKAGKDEPQHGRYLNTGSAKSPASFATRALRLRSTARNSEGLRILMLLNPPFCTVPAMAFESYLEFLRELEAAGELIRIREPVATELEITEFADREMKKKGGGK